MENLSQQKWVLQLENDENPVIIDVRREDEVAEGIIENAIHIDIHGGQEFIDKIQEIDKTKSLYVYCRSGNRSGQACSIMNQLGFEKAYNLEGGILEWEGKLVDLD